MAQETILYMSGQAANDGNIIHWQPIEPDSWDQLNEVGYRLERVEITEDGTEVVGSQRLIGDNFLPRDTNWFQANAFELNGLMGLIGTVLYDSAFQFPENDLMNANELRYHYLCYEAEKRPLIGMALGLTYVDTLIEAGKGYRYKISANDGSLANQIDLMSNPGFRTFVPDNVQIRYNHPNNMPLSDLLGVNENQPFDKIALLSRAYGDSIVLRWGPNHSEFWNKANKAGYYVLKKQDALEESFDTLAHVLPLAQEALDSSIVHDSMALVAVQMLYGNVNVAVEGIDQASNLYESKFGYSLYAAERSPLAADILGLRFVDTDVDTGKVYQYQVVSPASQSIFAQGNTVLENVYQPVPPPVGFTLTSKDKAVLLEWEKEANLKQFSSYRLERSLDGGASFETLKSQLVFVETPEVPIDIYNYVDSVETNYSEVNYRLRGMDSFGDTSEPAEVKGMGVDLTPPSQVSIYYGELNESKDTMHIKWNTPPLPDDFAGFYVTLGQDPQGDYDTISQILPGEILEYAYFTDSIFDGSRSHYFRVLSVDTAGNSQKSLEQYVHAPDIVPPDPPAKLEGLIEDDGTVQIAWEHSEAKDLAGYWLYFANDSTDEFTPVNTQLLIENFYTYKIPDNLLNEYIYYIIRSEDNTYHKSLPTDLLILKRPDKVPPAQPKMVEVIENEGALLVKWNPSFSKDVQNYHLFRKIFGTPDWQQIATLPAEEPFEYLDENIRPEVTYEYRTQAEDDVGLLSDFPMPQKGRVPFRPQRYVIENLKVIHSKDKEQIELSWTFDMPEASAWNSPYEFYIHKSEGRLNVDGWKMVGQNELHFSDEDFQEGVLYNYAIQVRFKDGKSGDLSIVKSVLIR